MKTVHTAAIAITKSAEKDLCGCITLGGTVFIISALYFLLTNNVAQAFVQLAH